jgi:hypothetical protein
MQDLLCRDRSRSSSRANRYIYKRELGRDYNGLENTERQDVVKIYMATWRPDRRLGVILS